MTPPLAAATAELARRDRRLGLGVLAAAIAVRLALLADVRDAPFWRVPLLDETAYIDLARRLLAGTPPMHGAWYVAPGYAYVLAGLFASGGGVIAAKLLNLAAGAGSAWLVWRLARRVTGPGAAFAAGLVWALEPAALLQEVLVLKSALTVWFVLAALVAIPFAPRRSVAAADDLGAAATWRWLAAGVCLGAATLLRGEMFVVAAGLVVAGWMARIRRWPGMPAAIAPALCLAVTLLAVAIPTAENHARSGAWVPIAFGGGTNFYIGNHPGADGGYLPLRPDRFDPLQEEADAVRLASRALGRDASPSEVSHFWVARGLAWWHQAPLRALALTAKKWALLWGPWELADVVSTPLAGRWVVWLRNPVCGPALVLPAAIAGLWIVRRRRDLWPLRAFLVAAQLAIVPFFLFERFRLHFIAGCLPFAAAAGDAAWGALRARRWRALARGAGATAAVAAALGLVRAPRDPVVLRVNAGEMFFLAGRYEEARREYEAVRTGAPNAWRVDINLANTELALGHDAAALAALDRVLVRLRAEGERTGLPSEEELAYCDELAGDLEHDRGRLAAAAAHYTAALRYAAPATQAALRAKLAACGGATAPDSVPAPAPH